MAIGRVYYSSDFRKAYRALPKRLQNIIDRKDALFRTDPFSPSLRTHKLHGPLQGLWSFSINREYRVLFEFVKDGALFLDVGTHRIYQ
ncbi:type II toxin-antitoxin system mRNA interferase toxin, RelE/StbE family [Candidatus Kaiserbacteria bacterium]|nr:type II toxin-antitoxin system mRNA interferase toxin, RelE/StbE family [Candidatus Kaiserbacteria bacterium]